MPRKLFSCTRGHPAVNHNMMMSETKKAFTTAAEFAASGIDGL